MAIFSPALVIAMCVMFVLTQINRYMFLFEVPLLFGLKYCRMPDPRLLHKISAPAAKPTVASLPARRVTIGHNFFDTTNELPYHKHIHYMLSLTVAYVLSAAFEVAAECWFPGTVVRSRSKYVAVFTVGYIVVTLWRISLFLASLRVMLIVAALSAFVVLLLVSVVVEPVVAFGALREALFIALRAGGTVGAEKADAYAQTVVGAAKVAVVVFVVAAAAAVVVPARKFSLLDFRLRKEYIQAAVDRGSASAASMADVYALPPPTVATVVAIAVDYVIPVMGVTFAGGAGHLGGSGISLRAVALVAGGALTKIVLYRVRLQAFLDGGLEAYRRFWTTRGVDSPAAASALGRTVAATVHFVPMMAATYVGITLLVLLPLGVAVVDGELGLQGSRAMCRAKGMWRPAVPGGVFVARVALFMAWTVLAAYTVFSVVSFTVELGMEALAWKGQREKGRRPVEATASQRRKLKRMIAGTKGVS